MPLIFGRWYSAASGIGRALSVPVAAKICRSGSEGARRGARQGVERALQVMQPGVGVAADGQTGRTMPGKLLARLDRRPAGHDARNVGMPGGVEVGHFAGRVAVCQEVRFLPGLPLGFRCRLFDPFRRAAARSPAASGPCRRAAWRIAAHPRAVPPTRAATGPPGLAGSAADPPAAVSSVPPPP